MNPCGIIIANDNIDFMAANGSSSSSTAKNEETFERTAKMRIHRDTGLLPAAIRMTEEVGERRNINNSNSIRNSNGNGNIS